MGGQKIMPFNLFPSPCCAQRRQSVILPCPVQSAWLSLRPHLSCLCSASVICPCLSRPHMTLTPFCCWSSSRLGEGGCLPSLLCHQVLISSCMVARSPIIPGPERCRQRDETLQVIFSHAVSSRSDQFGTHVTFESWNSSASSPNSGGVKRGWYSWLCSR